MCNERGDGAAVADDFLRQLVAALLEAVGGHGAQRQPARAVGEAPVCVNGVVVPLPLEAERGGEFVGLLEGEFFTVRDGFAVAGAGKTSANNGFADAGGGGKTTADKRHGGRQDEGGGRQGEGGGRGSEGGGAYDGPVVLPAGGLQVYDAAEDGGLLKMIEPPAAVGAFNKCALVGAIDGGGARVEDDAALVGSVDVSGAKYGLPAGADASFGYNEIVVAVAFQELGALCNGSGVYGDAVVEQLTAVGRHAVDDDGARAVAAAAEVGAAVVVPEGAGVLPLRNAPYAVQR